jgi:hypothetical protein
MAVLKKAPWMLIFFIFLGGLIGGILGEILRIISPEGTLQEIFSKAYSIGIDPPLTLDLRLFTTTLGFSFRMNLFSLLGILLGIYIYKQA